jgi:aminoglycoside phosphotransferase (APT) family kinase protein
VVLAKDAPVLALIAPPRLARFRELAGIGEDDAIGADFTGWSKLVLLTRELAVLFPRDHTQVEALEREVEALCALGPVGLSEVPSVVAVWDDRALFAHPVVAERRLPGAMLDHVVEDIDSEALAGVLDQVMALAARWHQADPGLLASRPRRAHPKQARVDALVAADGIEPGEAAAEVAARLRLPPPQQHRLEAVLERARSLQPVLVHGDLHEGQILVDVDLRVTGILDWQTARVAHPFTELDLGEWGTAAWRGHRRQFPQLRRRAWSTYAAARGLDTDLEDVFEAFWSVVHALRWPESVHVGSAVTGTFDEAMDAVRAAL